MYKIIFASKIIKLIKTKIQKKHEPKGNYIDFN